MIHSHMRLTLDNTTWFFVIVFNPFYVCFEPFGFRFHTLYDLIMTSEIPYHVEGDCGLPALSDASGTQSENPKSDEVDLPYVLKLSMGFGKLPLPNKKKWSANLGKDANGDCASHCREDARLLLLQTHKRQRTPLSLRKLLHH